ncbi:hypothetical protein BY458DRAFT_554036 [Sporodiniella umbellata]|nr:hypothetical protein BY458DRAFT_554036 [Sporodiniella umbellata]
MGIKDVVQQLNQSAGIESPLEIRKHKASPSDTPRALPPSPSTSPKARTLKPITTVLKPIATAPKSSVKLNVIPKKESFVPSSSEPPVSSKTIELLQKSICEGRPGVDMYEFDVVAEEILGHYQRLLEKYNESQEHVQRLESEMEKHASASTKVRDFEIRVKYLSQKLEQKSDERDYFEQELKRQMNQSAPLSPAFSQEQLDRNKSDTFLADLVNVYEESPEDKMQMAAYDRTVQTMVAKYVNDIEMQRLESKALMEVVEKQDELIKRLEIKNKENTDHLLLKEQMEVQRIELESKRELLSQLQNEREKWIREYHQYKRRSSIEMLTDKIAQLSRPSSISSGRGSPPLTAPPRHPLPPLPSLQH